MQTALSPSCAVQTEVEVAAEVQAIDAWIEPDPSRSALRAQAGLLGAMADVPCLFEPYHDTPGVAAIRDCLQKQLALHARQRRESRREQTVQPSFPLLWVVSTGRPEAVLSGYELRALVGWPTGCYTAAPALGLQLIVVRELPRTRETLLVRLMGAGDVLRHAIADLRVLPVDAWEREVALPALTVFRLTPMDPEDQTSIEREVAMDVMKLFNEMRKRDVESARIDASGDEHAIRLDELARLFAKKLGRALAEEELATLRERLDQFGWSYIEDAILELDRAALGKWFGASM
ncbi:hypothetical protein [Pendulispora albinea]|uniref:Uncharacterized protein n=1 Tax=Pendulispora albinea TaxID=2741071 RepID=A0ABZ2LXB9_9BACT